MSKGYGKPGKSKLTNDTSSRPGSRNGPKGKRKDPETDWKKYSERRKAEGENCRERMHRMADEARRNSGTAPGTRDRRVSAIPCSTVKSN